MPGSLRQEDIDKLTQLIGTDWQTADRVGFYVKYYELIKRLDRSAANTVLMQAHISSYSGFTGTAYA